MVADHERFVKRSPSARSYLTVCPTVLASFSVDQGVRAAHEPSSDGVALAVRLGTHGLNTARQRTKKLAHHSLGEEEWDLPSDQSGYRSIRQVRNASANATLGAEAAWC